MCFSPEKTNIPWKGGIEREIMKLWLHNMQSTYPEAVHRGIKPSIRLKKWELFCGFADFSRFFSPLTISKIYCRQNKKEKISLKCYDFALRPETITTERKRMAAIMEQQKSLDTFHTMKGSSWTFIWKEQIALLTSQTPKNKYIAQEQAQHSAGEPKWTGRAWKKICELKSKTGSFLIESARIFKCFQGRESPKSTFFYQGQEFVWIKIAKKLEDIRRAWKTRALNDFWA